MIIRNSKSNDESDILNIHLSAFGETEGKEVAELASNLLHESTEYSILSFVSEDNGSLIGHVIFSEVRFLNCALNAYILALLAVIPNYQKRKVGSSLIEHGINILSSKGVEIVFVYGDPAYYSRFGFSTDHSKLFVPPYKLQYSFGWQIKQLKGCILPSAPISLLCVQSLMKPELW